MLEETDEEILEEALIEIRQKFASESKEILLPFHLNRNSCHKTHRSKVR